MNGWMLFGWVILGFMSLIILDWTYMLIWVMSGYVMNETLNKDIAPKRKAK